MKIFIASDHAGFALKSILVPFLMEEGYEVTDCGAASLDEHDDYPDFVAPCAKLVAEHAGSFGIVIGASGQGEAMVANRVSGIRAAVYYGAPAGTQTDMAGHTLTMLESVRAHNDANILSLGARFITVDDAKSAIRAFLAAPFSNEDPHQRRIAKF